MTSSSDAPAVSSTVSMLLKVCSVCSTRSSLTTLPVFGSKPPWPDRKIHSPTVTPGEYGPAGAGGLSELTRPFVEGPASKWGSRSALGSLPAVGGSGGLWRGRHRRGFRRREAVGYPVSESQ